MQTYEKGLKQPTGHSCTELNKTQSFPASVVILAQGRSEGTSSVAFEVLIIKSEIDFINLFIFNCLTSNINLFIFICLTSNINLFIFNYLTSNFCFSKNILFANRRERLFMDARPQFRVFNSPGKMMTCYLRDTNKFLRYRTLCTNILKCGFPTKGIEVTQLEFLEGPRVLSFEALGLDHFGRFGTKICGIQVKL